MITLTNLTPLQRELCDVIWSIDDADQLRTWLQALPKRLRCQAQSLVEIMIMESQEAEVMRDLSDAKRIIARIQGRDKRCE